MYLARSSLVHVWCRGGGREEGRLGGLVIRTSLNMLNG